MSPRWLAWHVFCAVLIAGLVGMGVWQWSVATAPTTPGGPANLNLRNLVYAFQWWIFAAFGVWFWFRFIRDQRDSELAVSAAAEVVDGTDADGAGSKSLDSRPDQVPAEAGDQPISLDAPVAARAQRAQGAPAESADRNGGE